ncbi:MAG: hypothetical protein MHM6MM_006956 [Cercozoa sp. M6MM]
MAMRVLRDVSCAARMVLDYRRVLQHEHLTLGEDHRAHDDTGNDAHNPELEEAHRRNARRLERLIAANGGVYIKLGQVLATMRHLLPKQYVDALQSTFDRAPVSSFDDVRFVVESSLQAPLQQVFSEFEQRPIASASLAQVHRAVLRETGERVAVKVQHLQLKKQAASDLELVRTLVDLAHRFVPGLDLEWLVREFDDNLPKELNFRAEAANLEKCRALFADASDNIVDGVSLRFPEVHWDLTSPRMLVMSYESGLPLTRGPALRHAPLNVTAAEARKLSDAVGDVFARMTFEHGFVHSDPHPGNILVRRGANDTLELVLLDHGLYREVDTELRLNYARLWRGLIFSDRDEVARMSRLLGACGQEGEPDGERWRLFASMLTMRKWDEEALAEQGALDTRVTLQHDEIQRNAKEYAVEINETLGRIPRELLLLLKTNDCLRAVDVALGLSVASPVALMRHCTRAADAADDAADQRGGLYHLVRKPLARWARHKRNDAAISLAQHAVRQAEQSIAANGNSNRRRTRKYLPE